MKKMVIKLEKVLEVMGVEESFDFEQLQEMVVVMHYLKNYYLYKNISYSINLIKKYLYLPSLESKRLFTERLRTH